MDWPFNDPNFDKYDLDNVFEYSSRESTVLLRICGSKVCAIRSNLSNLGLLDQDAYQGRL
jgi:predicted DNA binding CopG/RHH family protein